MRRQVFRTLQDALKQLCLDWGYDPVETGEVWPTEAELRSLGYTIDQKAAEEQERQIKKAVKDAIKAQRKKSGRAGDIRG